MEVKPIGKLVDDRTRLVSSKHISDELSCPHCTSKTVSIGGFYKRGFIQQYIEGVTEEKDLKMEEKALQEIDTIFCSICGITTIIEDEDTFEREALIFDLQLKIAMLQGKIVTNIEGRKELIQ